MTRQEFIDQHSYLAINTSGNSGLFPSVKMAQAILESGNGNSALATAHNNYFGIKAGSSWTGEVASLKTFEFVGGEIRQPTALFRKYGTVDAGWLDHTMLLQNNSRYAGALAAETPFSQAEALAAAGYATDPAYADKLKKLINDNELTKLDKKKIEMKNLDMFIAVLMLIAAVLTIYKLTR